MKMGPRALEETSATPIAHEKRAPVLDGIIKRPVGMKRLGKSIKRMYNLVYRLFGGIMWWTDHITAGTIEAPNDSPALLSKKKQGK